MNMKMLSKILMNMFSLKGHTERKWRKRCRIAYRKEYTMIETDWIIFFKEIITFRSLMIPLRPGLSGDGDGCTKGIWKRIGPPFIISLC